LAVFYEATRRQQATIADLQGQLKAAKAPRMYDCGSCAIGKGFEQRVAQLEADHARVLGLVQALPVVPKEYLTDDFVHLGVPVTATLWAQIGPDLIALLTYRASLPAQRAKPAQGGAVSKPVTTCNRHSDCDAADEKARAKGALNADHCHDDCCSECFGN
jgi:hypothetical protein